MDAWIVYAWECGQWRIAALLLCQSAADCWVEISTLAGIPAFAVRQVEGGEDG